TWQSLYDTLQNAYQTFKQARQKVKVFQAFVDAGLVRANIARTKYNNGMMTFDEWDKIESDLITNQKNLLQSQRDLSLAAAAWEKALGTGVIP
ncbi:MAG: TolC family protein, partial [Bacteriovoracaceae bacterium]|nr:TolC family protein [Bacteriovoracaceae bacterium]